MIAGRVEELPVVPGGAPAWITPQLMAQTIETWQPYYRDSLTAQEAVDILLGVGRLLDILGNTP
jgi:hypothetical protein